jgi:hypothetical protein
VARLLKRVFDIDIAQCSSCGGKAKVIAAILESAVISKILAHLKMPTEPPKIHPARAPPQGLLTFEETFLIQIIPAWPDEFEGRYGFACA